MAVLMNIHIKENSLRAKIAAYYLNQNNVAIVFGRTVYLYKTSKENFLKDKNWVRHELQHIYQYKQYGYINFVFKYLMETFRNGYFNNRFEVEAREKEKDIDTLKNINFTC